MTNARSCGLYDNVDRLLIGSLRDKKRIRLDEFWTLESANWLTLADSGYLIVRVMTAPEISSAEHNNFVCTTRFLITLDAGRAFKLIIKKSTLRPQVYM